MYLAEISLNGPGGSGEPPLPQRSLRDRLLQLECGAAYNLTVDLDIYALGTDSECIRTQVVNVLTATFSYGKSRARFPGKRGARAFLSLVLPYTAKCVSIKRRQDLRGLQPRSGLTLARSYHDGS
jgi:hypothetical protein